MQTVRQCISKFRSDRANEIQDRLDRYFGAVFSDLPEAQIRSASVESEKGWDSVASATLITAIEEGFDVDTAAELTPYSVIAPALQS